MTVPAFNILHVDSSPVLEGSITRQLSARIVARVLERRPGAVVTVRDVGLDPPRHAAADVLDLIRFKRFDGLAAARAEEKALSDRLVGELLAADVIVIGTPMYNFTVTTQLKAWLDRVCQAGLTFRYTPEGPVGLATGKSAILAASRGGRYLGPEQAHQDFQLSYLKQILGFLGIGDVSMVVAEGVNLSPEHRTRALEMAGSQIDRMFAADGSAATKPSAADCLT
jgi:FMN-dependent NADH-azoreductase